MIYLLSPRSGGPYRQFALIAKQLTKEGKTALHCHGLIDWIKLHFKRRDKIVSVIPFLFISNRNNYLLNIRGNFRKEKRVSNPLSYFYERNLRLAKKVVVPSYYLQKALALPDAVVIPTSTSVPAKEYLKPEKNARQSERTVRLATITNFDFRPKAQGINKLINIVNQLETKQAVTIEIYGGGRWLEHAKKQYEMHNYKKFPVVWHGRFSDAYQVLPGNDIFMYWSTFDNMPNVLIEAMACGLPIVVNRYAAYAEVLGEDNLLASSEREFRDYIRWLIEDEKERDNYARKNRKRAGLFDIRLTVKDWMTVIDD